MRVCVRACVCVMFLLFVSESHNENKIMFMYVCYLVKCIHVCLIVPLSINKKYK